MVFFFSFLLMVLSLDGVALLTQGANPWHHMAWPLNKAGHSGAGKALHLPVAAAQLGALLGVLRSGGPSATLRPPEFLQVFLKERI